MQKRAFPAGFMWGASVAAHQVEGNNHNQWTEWERPNAERLAATAGKRMKYLPNWSNVEAQAKNPHNYLSGRGVEHYTRYREDFQILKQLHMNAFRFSIEWSRIEPEEGKWDDSALEYYRSYLSELARHGIEPVVTLWHWTVPVWFAQKGEFEKRRNLRYFERFVAKIAAELGDQFRYVTLLNEPNVHAAESYVRGNRPPERRNLVLALSVFRNLVLAHRRGYRILKRANPALAVGIAYAASDVQPARKGSPLDRIVSRLMGFAANWYYLDRIRKQLDFIGVNYYFTSYLTWRGTLRNPTGPLSDLGWYMEPKGLYRVLASTWQRYHKPLIVTENGLADVADVSRQWWLEQTLEAMQDTLADGVDLRGYLHWSLLDNFEWEHGWWPKFGLVAVDRSTMKRSIKSSARWFADYIQKQASDS